MTSPFWPCRGWSHSNSTLIIGSRHSLHHIRSAFDSTFPCFPPPSCSTGTGVSLLRFLSLLVLVPSPWDGTSSNSTKSACSMFAVASVSLQLNQESTTDIAHSSTPRTLPGLPQGYQPTFFTSPKMCFRPSSISFVTECL
jgi:hypothetical protein